MFNPILYPIQQNSGITLIGDRVKLKSLLFLERSPTQSAEYTFYFPANFGSDGQALFRSGSETTFRGIAIADVANLQTELDAIDTTLGTLGTAAFQPTTAFAASIHVHSEATTSVSGFLSNTDKTKIDGLGTASTKNTGTTNNTIPLIGAGDKLVSSIIPDINGTISDSFTLNSDAANSGSDRSIILSRSASQSASYTLVYPTALGTANQSLIISSISGSSAILGWGSSGSSSNVTALSGSSISIDLSLGTFFTITLSANTSISSITNALGNGVEFTIKITQNSTGGFTFSPPAGVAITGSIDTAASSQSLIKFFTFNGGTNWEAVVIKPLPNATTSNNLWTPANSSFIAWWDAGNSSSISLGTGVSQINDLSGNNRHLTQSSASSQPAYISNGLNNLGTIRLDGVNDLLTLASTITTIRAVFIVFKYTNQTGSWKPILGHGTLGGWDQDWQGSGNGTDLFDASFTNASIINGSKYVNETLTSGVLSRYTSFTMLAINTTGNVRMDNVSADRPSFFSDRFSPLEFAEIVISDVVFTDTIRQKLAGYAAYKRGLQSLLPSGHPYKTSPPTV